MNGSIRTDRRYTLGEYKYTTMEDIIENIPSNLYLNTQFTTKLRFLQLLSFEIAYRRYIRLVSAVPHTMPLEEAINELEKLRDEEISHLKILLNGDLKDETNLEE